MKYEHALKYNINLIIKKYNKRKHPDLSFESHTEI